MYRLLLCLLVSPSASALQLFRPAPDGSTYTSFLVTFLSLACLNLLIFAAATVAVNCKRRSLIRAIGQQLQYEPLDFDDPDALDGWKRVPEEKKKPAGSPKPKKKGLFALKKEATEREKSAKSQRKPQSN